MPKFFRSEPGVVRLEDDGSATMATDEGSWSVDPEEILFDEASPEISEEEYNLALSGMREARSLFRDSGPPSTPSQEPSSSDMT